ncbi:MAG: family metallopeptidase [Burkholderiaceae bacterium]|nr:family metallopeptidase [Burkholderiaceae bacterium]
MSPSAFSIVFLFFLLTMLAVRFWLGVRHIRHVRAHRETVPAQFAASISLEAHRKAADYTIAKTRLGLAERFVEGAALLGFTLLGGLQLLHDWLFGLAGGGMALQLGLLAVCACISGAVEMPFGYYRQFVLEQAFGFNRMTPKLFWIDLFKGAMLGAVIGLPLAWVLLVLMGKAGVLWWLYAWLCWVAFQLGMLVLYPTVIAPLFNKFTPLSDDALRSRIEDLMQRTGFASKGLFVMDGSKRSAHGNAYFSGFGAAKRIVFFDTLIERLAPPEIEAVLAHELGHFRLRHIIKRMALMFLLSLLFFALLGYLKAQPWFYAGLGVNPHNASTDAMALLLFVLVMPVFTFFGSPLASISSRRHEYEADAFAAEHTKAQDLVTALVKMYEDNASTLTPDPLYSAFYDSHPPASLRVDKLLSA